MNVSLNTIKQWIDFDLPPVDELVTRINAQLGGVEKIIDLRTQYQSARIVKVLTCQKHPNADKLSVCTVDVGEGTPIQVVCGAPNVHTDMWAVWLPPGSVVPSTYGTKDEFKLDAREIRGVMSYGMLAAGDELGINADHEGIMEIDEHDLPSTVKSIQAGQAFSEVFGLDDTVIVIENKMFTHRPDCFGQLGVVREISGILGYKFTSPDWYLQKPGTYPKPTNASIPLQAFNDVTDKAARFMAVGISNVTVSSSPLWLQCALVAMGSKPINNIVDATNYFMLITGQPTHAYDADIVQKNADGTKHDELAIGVRMALPGESITLLNGKTYKLDVSDIVIANHEQAIGLAGIMGGKDTQVSAKTNNIILECANFDMYTIRKSSMRHGLFTDAVTRFNKGQSPIQTNRVLFELLKNVIGLAGGVQASEISDIISDSLKNNVESDEYHYPVTLLPQFVHTRLGLSIKKYDMVQLLKNVEFTPCEDCGWNPEDTKDDRDDWHVSVPFWRTDIHDPEDIVEEVGRLYGFEKLPRELPERSIRPVAKNPRREMKMKIRSAFSDLGANEVLTYSFVHKDTFQKAEQDHTQAFQISNALSPELQYYRLTVLPSLLDKVYGNIKAGHDEFILFEIGKGHNKKYHAADDNGLPRELEFVDAVYASKKPREGSPYYQVRQLASQFCMNLGFTCQFKPITKELDYPVTAPFDQSRSALIETREGTFIGMIGELKQTVLRSFKLPIYTAAMTLDFEGIMKAHTTAKQLYLPLSRYPSVTQDISLKVPMGVRYAEIFEVVEHTLEIVAGDKQCRLLPLSIYQSSEDKTSKTITLRVTISDMHQTLTDQQVSRYIEAIAQKTHEQLGAIHS